MAKVDPFVIQWPRQWLEDPQIQPVIKYLNRFLHDLWKRSGGGDDFIENIELDLTVINARLDALELDVAVLQAAVIYLEGLTVVTALDYTIDNTVTGHQTVICTAAVTISLDSTPNDRDTAEIKVGQKGTRVIIDGNGKLIEQGATMVLRSRNTKRQIGMKLRYSEERDAWYTT